MRRQPPALYIITDRQATQGRPLGEVLAAALRGGPPQRMAVQLREKDLDGGSLVELGRAVRSVLEACQGPGGRARLFINDRLDVALAVGADGVHLTGQSVSAVEAKRAFPALQVAVSTHSSEEVKRALAAGVDFAVFGPVFDTPSKRALGRPVGEGALAEVAALGLPLVALGGVTPQNAASCLRAGAHGVACIRSVMEAPDPKLPVAAFFDVLERFLPHRSAGL